MKKVRVPRRELESHQDMSPGDALQQLFDLGIITKLEKKDTNAWMVKPLTTFDDFGQYLSARIRHLVWPSTRRCTARNGGSKIGVFYA